jgi:hypothetical protein
VDDKKADRKDDDVQHCVISTEKEIEAEVIADIDDWRKAGDGDEWNKRIKELDTKDMTGLGRRAPAEMEWREELQKMARNSEKPPFPTDDDKGKDDWMCMNEVHTRQIMARKHDYGQTMTASSWNFVSRERHQATEASAIKAEFLQDIQKRRHANDIVISTKPLEEVMYNGKTYTRSSPTYFEARIGSSRAAKMHGLLDNCAQLLLIRKRELDQMPEDMRPTMYERPVNIRGMGNDISKHFVILPIYVDSKQRIGKQERITKIEIPVEFHVIEDINEPFVIGMDVIGAYQIDVIMSKRIAVVNCAQQLAFPIYFNGPVNTAIEEEMPVVICQTMTIPPRCEVVIPIAISSTTLKNEPDMDLWFDPVAISHVMQNTWGSASAELHTNRSSNTVFPNLESHPITLRRGTRVAFTSRMGMTDEITRTKIRHVVGGTRPAEFFSCVPKRQTYRPAVPTTRKDNDVQHWSEIVLGWDRNKDAEMMEAAELPDPNDRPPTEVRENAQFDVLSDFGVDGKPPSILLDVLARNRDAFTFDGKPGLVL